MYFFCVLIRILSIQALTLAEKLIYEVHLKPNSDANSVAKSIGLENLGRVGSLPDDYIFSGNEPIYDPIHAEVVDTYHFKDRKKRSFIPLEIITIQKEVKKLRKRRASINIEDDDCFNDLQIREDFSVIGNQIANLLNIHDPEFRFQWHLFNTRQIGNDLNVTGVWSQGITGKGIAVAVVDDGLDYENPDLATNFFAEGSYDFNRNQPLPTPEEADFHGTRCGGEIAAVRNDVCGIGVAFDAKIAGNRILGGPISDAEEARSLNYAFNDVSIYSCSWGPTDDGKTLDGPSPILQRAIQHGVNEGRHGLGSIYVFASGNGGRDNDGCNYDGYANSIYVSTIGAVDRQNRRPVYVEHCAKCLAVTYSSGFDDAIHTTDLMRDRNKVACTRSHSGTSAAAPLAAGVYALALSVRPELTWRDIQSIQIFSARSFNEEDESWAPSGIPGKKYSHWFGFGLIDAYALVDLAKTWTLINPQQWFESPVKEVNLPVDFGNTEYFVESVIEINETDLVDANLKQLEHIQVTVNLKASKRGDIEFYLISPNGIVSELAKARSKDRSTEGFKDWTFASVKHWTENPIGNWTLKTCNVAKYSSKATLQNWKLKIYGPAVDATKATKKHPLPTALPSSSLPSIPTAEPTDPQLIDPLESTKPNIISTTKSSKVILAIVLVLEFGCVITAITIIIYLKWRPQGYENLFGETQYDYLNEDIEINEIAEAFKERSENDNQEDEISNTEERINSM